MKRLLHLATDLVRAMFKPRADLALENLALRQQLAVLKDKRPRPRLTNADRVFWIGLSRIWRRWTAALVVVKPETVVRWHGTRRIRHANVTAHPTSEWVVQQLREAYPYDEASRFLIHDRDTKFGERVAHALASIGVEGAPTAHRSPWQNGVAERWIGSCRRELLDHVMPFGEDHMRRLLRGYVAYYNEDRTHLSLGKETPAGRETMARSDGAAEVVALPRVGGIHHRYEWRRAA